MELGKKFSLRNSNCYHFIQQEYPELPDIKYKVLSTDTFLEIALDNGFHLVDLKDSIKGDVFITSEPTHLLIYMDNNIVAHHHVHQLSKKESITEDIFNSIKYVVRRDK